MKSTISRPRRSFAVAAAGLIASSLLVQAPIVNAKDDYPTRPIRLTVGFSPGGGIDTVARIVAQEVAKTFPQPIVVENRPGAGGNIAADSVAKAPPDGYSLHFAAPGSAVINHHLIKPMPYEFNDLTPVTLVGTVPLVVIVPVDSPLKSLQDLVATARAQPDKLTYGTPGVGTSNHMATELFLHMAQLKAVHVPYKGPAANTDLIAGRLDFIFDAITTATPFITGGKVRALAVTTPMRSPMLPDVPTIAELGFPKYSASNWYGVVTRAGTPAPVVSKLNAAMREAVRQPEVTKRLEGMGVIVRASTVDEFRQFLDEQHQAIGQLVKAAGIKIE
jgi:tripartite-type tricarboxylate transporter receptor subunit TctC